MYTVRRRSYDPGLGRWTQGDPEPYVDGGNLYEFVRDNPISFLDPSGLASIDDDDEEYNPGGVRIPVPFWWPEWLTPDDNPLYHFRHPPAEKEKRFVVPWEKGWSIGQWREINLCWYAFFDCMDLESKTNRANKHSCTHPFRVIGWSFAGGAGGAGLYGILVRMPLACAPALANAPWAFPTFVVGGALVSPVVAVTLCLEGERIRHQAAVGACVNTLAQCIIRAYQFSPPF